MSGCRRRMHTSKRRSPSSARISSLAGKSHSSCESRHTQDRETAAIMPFSVPVPVMDVVDVGMAMNHRLVAMPVGMRQLRELLGRVVVLVVLVVGLFVPGPRSLAFV